MTKDEKLNLLASFKTGELVAKLKEAEEEYVKLLSEQGKSRAETISYLKGSRGTDSEAVAAIEDNLFLRAPAEINGKKATEADRKAWLSRQRTENKELADAINKQRMAEVIAGDFDVRIKVAEIQMQNCRSIISLRTAQLAVLAGKLTLDIE